MRLAEVLASVEGLNKRFVHYLEALGYIRPAKLQKSRIARREYTDEDLRTIRAIWRYYKRGYALQRAWELVSQTPPTQAFVALQVPPRRRADAIELLRRFADVYEAAAVYGESSDVVARIVYADEADLYEVLAEAFKAGDIAGVPKIWRLVEPPAIFGDGKGKGMLAYVLIKVPAKLTGGVVEDLRRFSGVTEAGVVYGETDIIAKIEVPDQDALDDLIIHRIQGLPAVESTRTFLVVGGMYWQRA